MLKFLNSERSTLIFFLIRDMKNTTVKEKNYNYSIKR